MLRVYFEPCAHLPAGRGFTEEDNLPGRDGVIVDGALAAKAFPGRLAIGKRILIHIRTRRAGAYYWLRVIGIVLGLIGSVLLGRVLSAMLVSGVEPTDAATFVGMTAGFLAISAFASWLPARRASVLDPVKALREQ